MQYSPAQLLLLGKFRSGAPVSRFHDAGQWESALGEKPARAIARLVSDSMLEPAGLTETLGVLLKATDLKAILREKSLKVSGPKGELIRRLIDHDQAAMEQLTRGASVYTCTSVGSAVAEAYVEEENAKREAAEKEAFGLLLKGEYANAVRVVVSFETAQVFQRGLGIDWATYDGKAEIEVIGTIYTKTPTILRGIQPDPLKHTRAAAAMMELWGTGLERRWLPPGFETGVHLNPGAACRMLLFHAIHLRNIKEFEDCGIRTVQISGVSDFLCCEECRRIEGKTFRLDEAPELPYARCTSENGCRCTISADFDSIQA